MLGSSLVGMARTVRTGRPRDKDFQDQTVLVTGAGNGMGAATAVLLAQRGANVVIVGRREKPLPEVEKVISRPEHVRSSLPVT